MPVDAEVGKSDEHLDRYNHRKSNFYSQTIAENNARLLEKFPNDPDLRNELEFIHADMIIAGSP
jgi:hypothetical protein